MAKKTRASDDVLGAIHEAIAKQLLSRITSGEADPRDFSNAIRFLKDNGVEAVAAPGSALGNLAESLPKFGGEDKDNPLYN